MNDEELVRERCASLLAANDPTSMRPRDFLGAQFDAGLAWVHFPDGHGGLGIAPGLQKMVSELLGAASAPHAGARNPIGYGMGAPTIVAHGSIAQQERYLRPLFTGEEVWCQTATLNPVNS